MVAMLLALLCWVILFCLWGVFVAPPASKGDTSKGDTSKGGDDE